MEAGDNTERASCSEQMSRLDSLTSAMSGWKEWLIMAENVLLWREKHYSYCIAGCVTLIYIFWWWMDISVVTTAAAVLCLLVTADYVLPSLGSKLRGNMPWEGDQERQYEAICQSMLDLDDMALAYWQLARESKDTHPKTYIAVVSGVLFFTGLLGYAVDNGLLCYFTVLLVSLLPGAMHHGYVKQLYGKACQMVQKSLSQVKPKQQ